MCLVFLISTGIFLHVALPHGSGQAAVLGFTRHEWGEVHFALALTFLGLIIVHVLLHWSWICCVAKGKALGKKLTMRIGIIIAVLLTVVIIALLPFFAHIESLQDGGGRGWRGGRMSHE